MNILVTGGAGFVGSNLVAKLASLGHRITVFDNLSRAGSEHNLRWLTRTYPELTVYQADIREPEALMRATENQDAIFHLAAQVAVTTSVVDPRTDFEVNLLGSLNVLEAVRKHGARIPVIFTSTNKVYGKLDFLPISEQNARYQFQNLPEGVGENNPLDFYSPYGCSKGGADQYIHDYYRIYEIPTVICRMSCIYGERQMGNEDQGWVAHFLIQAARGKGVTVYGDGKQVRDVLYVSDLVALFTTILDRMDQARGNYYNIGGGRHNTLSLNELIHFIHNELKIPIPVSYGPWRPGDQKVYISSITKAGRELGWRPQVSVSEGLHRLYEWIQQNRGLFGM